MSVTMVVQGNVATMPVLDAMDAARVFHVMVCGLAKIRMGTTYSVDNPRIVY